jgi:hypothetical protein
VALHLRDLDRTLGIRLDGINADDLSGSSVAGTRKGNCWRTPRGELVTNKDRRLDAAARHEVGLGVG